MIVIEPTAETKARIAANMHLMKLHALPIWLAVRDMDCTYINAPATVEPFSVRADRPTIAVFGDDFGYGTAKGPDGFDRASLAAYLGQCRSIALVTSEAVQAMYVLAAATAVKTTGWTAIIESLPEKEADWLAFIAEVAPRVPLVLCTVECAGGVH